MEHLAKGAHAAPQRKSSSQRAQARHAKAQGNPLGRLMSSKPIIALVGLVAGLCLMVSFVAVGLGVCVLPASTTALANATVMDKVSPFSHDQLVQSAQAVRDYSFGSHSQDALYATMRDINLQLLDGAQFTSAKAPDAEQLKAAITTDQLREAFSHASDVYALDADAISHLDDVYNVASTALIAVALLVVLGIAALAHLVFYCGTRGIWKPLAFSGGILLVVFAVLRTWAAIDFYGLFTVFHSLFFSAGTWTFSYESLLICSLPTEFWMGMGAIWLITTCILCIASLAIGLRLRHER